MNTDNPILCDDGRRPDWKVGFSGRDIIWAGDDAHKAIPHDVAFVLVRETTEDEFIAYWSKLGPAWRRRYEEWIYAFPAQRRYFEAAMD